jgi:hypothetical protein
MTISVSMDEMPSITVVDNGCMDERETMRGRRLQSRTADYAAAAVIGDGRDAGLACEAARESLKLERTLRSIESPV